MSDEDFDSVLGVHLKGTFNFAKNLSRPIMKSKHGRIINMTSVVGMMGNAGQANYSAAKAGIIGITKTLAKELASRNVTVNAIAPGFIDTDMTVGLPQSVKEKLDSAIPLKRLGTVDDVANLALFLASDLSSYITGEIVKVDGGMYI
jgi:3-oxoacyl-[acyl-carrier protein] reductase